jgi:hypothetical protein
MRRVPQTFAAARAVSAALICLALACGPSGSRQLQPPVLNGDQTPSGRRPPVLPPAESPGTTSTGNPDGAVLDPESPPDAAATPPAGLVPPGTPSPTDAALLPLGATCAAGASCASGNCADGVCCADACEMACHSCAQASALGRCTPIAAGLDPDAECAMQPATSCGRDGTCDGQGGCRLYPRGTQCAPGGCEGDLERSARLCDGTGACQPPRMRSCAPAVCRQDSCSTRCVSAADCQDGFFCDGGTCRIKRTQGQACTAAGQCASGACVDGVCCNSACNQTCELCNLTGSVGECRPIPAGVDPGGECAATSAATCGTDGTCNGAGACRLHLPGTVCAAATCSGQTASSARLCNGRGACLPPPATVDCGGFACSGDSCGTVCSGAAGCAPGFTCNGQVCAEDGLALYWKLDEAEGATAADSSGNGLNGTYLADPNRALPSTPVEPALRFANPRSRAFSGSQAIVLPSMPGSLRPSQELTLSVWYRATAVDSGGSELISLGNNTLMRVRANDLDVSKRVPNGATGAYARCFGGVTNHLDGNWHHVATVIDASTVTVYFDGVQVCQLMNVQPLLYDRGADLFVGRHGEGQETFDFSGNIDEVRVYTRALSPDRIAALARGSN